MPTVLPDLSPAAETLTGTPPSAALVPSGPVTWAERWRPPERAASVGVGETPVAAVGAGGIGGLVFPELVWAFRLQVARCVARAWRGTPRGEVPSLGFVSWGSRGLLLRGFESRRALSPGSGDPVAGDWIPRLWDPGSRRVWGRGSHIGRSLSRVSGEPTV